MKYIILTFISIALIIIGFAIKAEAITVTVESYEQCIKKNTGERLTNTDKPIAQLSNGYSIYIVNRDIPCAKGFTNEAQEIVVFEQHTLDLEALIHESVHLAQNETSNKEKQARLTTKYFFEILEKL